MDFLASSTASREDCFFFLKVRDFSVVNRMVTWLSRVCVWNEVRQALYLSPGQCPVILFLYPRKWTEYSVQLCKVTF